jgi:hypothetical protein
MNTKRIKMTIWGFKKLAITKATSDHRQIVQAIPRLSRWSEGQAILRLDADGIFLPSRTCAPLWLLAMFIVALTRRVT